jgi:agmatinase
MSEKNCGPDRGDAAGTQSSDNGSALWTFLISVGRRLERRGPCPEARNVRCEQAEATMGDSKGVPEGRVVLIGLPFDENSSFMRGAAEAPPLIRAALFSDASNMWSESGVDLSLPGLLGDAGDLVSDPGEDPFDAIERAIAELATRGLRPIALGGDHAISFPVVRALSAIHHGLSILHVDAHPDLYDEFRQSRRSHACPFARIMESGLARKLVQVGIRAMNGHQRDQARRFGVESCEMRNWRDGIALEFDGPLYLSVDLDGLDPAFAPGVSHREPGGLSSREVIGLIQGLRADVIGADVVEFNPRQDPSGVTALVCGKLVKEIASKMLGEPGRQQLAISVGD